MPIVELFGPLAEDQPSNEFDVAGNTVSDVLNNLLLSVSQDVSKLQLFFKRDLNGELTVHGLIICINQKIVNNLSDPLLTTDRITLVPAMSGG